MTEAYQMLDLSGERFLPGFHGKNIEIEHFHRYMQACEVTRGKVVLDIASGEGYGSAMLAKKATRVIGVDISSDAVMHARRRYRSANLEYMVGSCSDIPLPDSSVDVVVSFETIEHHDQHEGMMREIKRVLRPSGFLIISSPDKYNYSVEPGYKNEFHVKELYEHEFKDLLSNFFKNINYFGQRVIYGSGIFAFDEPSSTESYRQHDDFVSQSNGLFKPVYWIAVASDERVPRLSSGVFEQPVEDSEYIQHWIKTVSSRDEKIAKLELVVSDRDSHISNLNQALGGRDEQIASLHQKVVCLDGQIATQQEESERILADKALEIDHLRQQLRQILLSRSWRLTAPLRNMVVLFGRGVRKFRSLFTPFLPDWANIWMDGHRTSAVRQIRESQLFDADFYSITNPDVDNAGVDLARHYFACGWRQSRDPSAAFSTSGYLSANPDVARAGINPLLHYLQVGMKEGRAIGSSKRVSGALVAASTSVFQPPVKTSAAVIDAEVDAIRQSGLFDEAFYRTMSPALPPVPSDAIRHYCEFGWREGRNPSDDFNTNFYRATYSDIGTAGLNPFWHYIVAGAKEMRQPTADAVMPLEDDIQFGDVQTDVLLLAFYASPDWAALRNARPMFKGHSQQPPPNDDLGFYDAADGKTLVRQALLAKRHGLYGFCFDLDADDSGHPLVQPVESFLGNGGINFGFCVQVKPTSEHGVPPLVTAIARAVSDQRYIRLGDRPLILIKLPGNPQHAASFLHQLKSQLTEQGVVHPFWVGRWVSHESVSSGVSLAELCDGELDQPSEPLPVEAGGFLPRDKNGADVIPYAVIATCGVARAQKAQTCIHPVFHCVTLGRDNTSTKPARPLVYTRFTLRDYRRWLDAAICGARAAHPDDRRFVFLNAWNDWNEGLYLEPDRKGGFSRVNETSRALLGIPTGTKTPKVSVIVPNYNHAPFLRRRLNSIYSQTYKNIEVILLDDCSSDQSRSVMDDFAQARPDITQTLYNVENSGGAFRQWAKGIKAATGDLVWIAESDDYCAENFLEVLVRCFDDEAVLLASSKCVFVDKDEVPLENEFQLYLSDLACAAKWNGSYVETAHNEVRNALGIKNTIPNASGVVFRRPVDMPLLNDESWLSMRVAGDWVFYLHAIRGGKIAYGAATTNFFRRYKGSTAEATYKKEIFYREVGLASRTVAALYNVPLKVLEQCREGYSNFYQKMVGRNTEEFAQWYDYDAILQARQNRLPNVLVSTMAFHPGGAEILPIRLANEFKRQGLSVLLLSAGLMRKEDGVRRMLRNDVPVIETASISDVKTIIHDFGLEALNTHQWHIQQYPLQLPDVFTKLKVHIASLHGMIEHEEAFGVTKDQLRKVDQKVTTWVYTADKNLTPFLNAGLYDKSSPRFIKIPNGMQPPRFEPVSRADLNIPEDAFTLCCVSRAIPDKGWAETIQVVEQARALSGRDIRLILVGNGPIYEEYCRDGVPDFVYLAGFSENSVGYYAAADMGIMLTKFKSESFPLTIVDCLFAGNPFVASDVGDIRNMLTISDQIAGEVIPLENWTIPIATAAHVVASYATDEKKYTDARALVKDLANRYRIDGVAAQYIHLFQSGCNITSTSLGRAN